MAVGRKALLHFGRVEAGELPDHRYDGDVDLGEYVGRHFDDRGDAEKQNQRRHHIEGVGIFQREADESQAMPPLAPGPTSDLQI